MKFGSTAPGTAARTAATILALCATACSGGGGSSSFGAVPSTNTANKAVGSTPTPSPAATATAAPTNAGTSGPGTPAATATPSPTSQSSTAPTSAPSSIPTNGGTSTPAPTATPKPATPAPTPSPVPTAQTTVYDPPAGTFSLFPSNVFIQPIPSNPSVNANSASWLASEGTLGLGNFQFAANSAGLAQDYAYAIYNMSTGPGAEAVKIHCTASWGCKKVEGMTIHVDPRELPEDGGTSGEDSHMAFVDSANGKEFDFWNTQWPPVNGVLTVGSGGECTLSGNGYDGCGGTSSNTPQTLGIVRAKDLLLAIQSPNGTLPYALATAVKCNYGYVAPATSSDGKCSSGPPQGARLYLAMHDSEINATNNVPIAKAMLRTIDEDHYGMVITNTDGGQDGLSFQLESDLSYTSLGMAAPYATQFVAEARAEGLGTTTYNNVYHIVPNYTGIDFTNKLKFL